MEFLAVLGAINLMLASAIVVVLPIVLAIYVAPGWLWLYALYFLLIAVFASLIAGSKTNGDSDSTRGPGDGE